MSDLSPLSGVERKLAFRDVRAAVDPNRTSGKKPTACPRDCGPAHRQHQGEDAGLHGG